MDTFFLTMLIAVSVIWFIPWMFIVVIEHRDVNKMCAWIVITVILPVIGSVGYFVIGQRIWLYRLYKDRKMTGDGLPSSALPEELSFMECYEGTDCCDGNRTEFFSDGRDMFNRMIADIRDAKKTIRMEFYIILDDELGGSVLDLLSQKAKGGVDVILICDGFGCRRMIKDSLAKLTGSGMRVVTFNRPGPPYLDPKMNNRDHRKITIIDGRICYCGGFNVCTDYIGEGHVGYWRDSAVRIEGPAAAMMERRFLNTCRFSGSDVDDENPVMEIAGDDAVVTVYGGPDLRPNPIMELHLNLIRNAKESIRLQTPYFTNKELIRAVKNASESGVKVTLILPKRIDHWFTFWNNFSCARMLKDTDVDIYLYQNGFMHSKTIIVDDRVCIIGSSNFDDRTAYYNFETSVAIISKGCTDSMKKAFEADLKESVPMVFEDYSGIIPLMKRAICGVIRCLG